MSTHKLFTPFPTNRPNKEHGFKHLAVCLISLLDCHLLPHWETLFIHGKGKLNQIFFFYLYQHWNWAWPLLCHILYFLLTFMHQSLSRSSIFANWLCLGNISFLNLCDVFVNFTGRVIIPPILHRSRWHTLEKWLVAQHARTTDRGY